MTTLFVVSRCGRFTKTQIFAHYESAKSYYVSATAIVIENRNDGLRNRKLDFERYRLCTVGLYRSTSSQVYFEMVGVVVFRTAVVPSDEVGRTFANETMPTIPADDRCRKFEDYIDYGCDFAPD